MDSGQLKTWRILTTILALILSVLACNAPGARPNAAADAGATGTPFIIYITATPPQGQAATLGPQFGPGDATMPSEFAEPTLDLTALGLPPTLQPTPTLPATGTATPLPTDTPTTTAVPPTATPSPTSKPPTATAIPRDDFVFAPNFGLNFISSAQHPGGEERFAAGARSGAGWDRFAIYWSDVEAKKDTYTWGLYDQTVINSISYGFSVNAILLGTPSLYFQQGGVPVGLYEPVFSDGTDKPGSGKQINPSNPWAEFVHAAVNRYRPGGTIARQQDWPAGQGVRVWEIWNEPDFSAFWGGSVQDYARLLKVAYIAANQADPDGQIMVGGLVLFEKPAWLPDLLNTFKNDESPVDGRYPFDIVAVHSYNVPIFTFRHVQRTESLLAAYGQDSKPIWINESGVALWDDYPGPTWATRADQKVWRSTQEEQAAYIIQNAALAFIGGAENLFHFQLYDDCGNQPRGTNFSPHDGSLCNTGAVCWGDALGLMRNDSDNTCFSLHPKPGTARPAYDAYRTAVEIFGVGRPIPLQMFTSGPGGRQRWMIFARRETSELIFIIWNEGGSASEATIIARAPEATVIALDGSRTVIKPGDDDLYRVDLAPATNSNLADSSGYMIGGRPLIFVQQTDDPFVSVLPLVEKSRAAFSIRWRSSRSDIGPFEIYYRDDSSGGEWQLWLEADKPGEALFVGGSGRRYSFFARARLDDDSWTDVEPYVQATTQVE